LIFGSANYAELPTLRVGENDGNESEVTWVTCRSEHSCAQSNEAFYLNGYVIDEDI